jgi:hypothetical protein
MAKRHVVASKPASDQVGQVFHDLRNNFAAIGLWVTMLLESSCGECRDVHERVAEAIGRNLAEAQGSTRRLRALGRPVSPRRAAMNGRRRRRAG